MPKKKHSSNSSLGKSLLNKASSIKAAKIAPSQEGFKVVSPLNKSNFILLLIAQYRYDQHRKQQAKTGFDFGTEFP